MWRGHCLFIDTASQGHQEQSVPCCTMSMARTFHPDSENARLSFERLKLLPMDVTHHDEKGKYASTGEWAHPLQGEPATHLWTPDKQEALKPCKMCRSLQPRELAKITMTRSCLEVKWSPDGNGLSKFGQLDNQPLCGHVSRCAAILRLTAVCDYSGVRKAYYTSQSRGPR